MRHIIIAALSSLVVAGNASAQSDKMIRDTGIPETAITADSMAQNSQNHMFDGIELSEQQRQQMRDLMSQARQVQPAASISDIVTMHQLITGKEFNETAVRAQAEKAAKIHTDEQVEMARIRHQMYSLLTTEQQERLQQNFDVRINNMRSVSQLP